MLLLRRSVCGLLLAAFVATAARAQDATVRVVVPGESLQARNRLRAIERPLEPVLSLHAAAGCIGQLGRLVGPLEAPFALAPAVATKSTEFWEPIEEAYYALLHDAGEALVMLPAEPGTMARTSLQVRRLCHMRLAALPASVLAAYRARVDGEAGRLLALGQKDRDSVPLGRLVDEMFCSGPADRALDLLGDLAFERGEFAEACHWWRRVAPLPLTAGDPTPFRYPGPTTVDRVRVEAKQILALAFAGQLAEAQEQLDRFHRRHPGAHGALAGKDGSYSAAVQEAIHGVVQAGIANNADPWPTYAGAPTRNRVLTVCPPARLWEDGPTWHVALPVLDVPRKGKHPQPAPVRRAAFHPVIAGQQVLLAEARAVTSFDLATGKRLFRYELPGAALPETNDPGRNGCFTLTVDRDRAYARLGRPSLAASDQPSYLVCLDLVEPGNPLRRRTRWQVKAETDDGHRAFFEGAPLVRAGRTFVAMSRLAGQRIVTAVQCYDALGRLRWSRDVCDLPDFEEPAASRPAGGLLTWAGGQLVYCTHTGIVLAVDPWTGQTLWAVRYASRSPSMARDPAPCVYHEGRVYVAPADSDRLYCLDACTGRVLWERDGMAIVHVLGVSRGQVFLTTRHGLQAVTTRTGLTAWQQPSAGRLAPLGRGLLAGGWLFWPTQDVQLPLRAVCLVDGAQQRGDDEMPYAEPGAFDPTQLRLIPPGNLAFGQGCLVIAGTDELVAFVPAEPLPNVPPPDAHPHLQSASAMARPRPAIK